MPVLSGLYHALRKLSEEYILFDTGRYHQSEVACYLLQRQCAQLLRTTLLSSHDQVRDIHEAAAEVPARCRRGDVSDDCRLPGGGLSGLLPLGQSL